MTDKFGRVFQHCDWCGERLHQITDKNSGPPKAVYNDKDRRQYCSLYCARRGYAYYNDFEWPELIEKELWA